MTVLVDTSVWSLSLRRVPRKTSDSDQNTLSELRELIDGGMIGIIGPVRQELLSGIRHQSQFDRLREILRCFPDESLETADYEDAAAAAKVCMDSGVVGSHVDLLICAAAKRRGWSIFTNDRDFQRYAPILGLRLWRARA